MKIMKIKAKYDSVTNLVNGYFHNVFGISALIFSPFNCLSKIFFAPLTALNKSQDLKIYSGELLSFESKNPT